MCFKIVCSVLLFCAMEFVMGDSYEGYKIYDVLAKNEREMEKVKGLAENMDYDFFILPKVLLEAARVMIQPKDQSNFETILNNYNINFTVVNDNVGRTVEKQSLRNNLLHSRIYCFNPKIIFYQFLRYEEIITYLNKLAASNPNIVTLKTIGTSYEERDLNVVIISNGNKDIKKKTIVVDAGVHAREWIAPSTALYVIYQLVENFEANSYLLEECDFIILPLVNPDGYEYSHTKSRFWRKNRKPVTEECIGTDLNRNFDIHWGEGYGSSTNPCFETFRGVEASSEPETKILSRLLVALTGKINLYLTLHSYGNYLLYPWAYADALPANWIDLDDVAQAGADAIFNATGTTYTVGTPAHLLYAAGGGSDDFALGVANVSISITMELPAGGSGFDPYPEEILPSVRESWIGIKAIFSRVISKY